MAPYFHDLEARLLQLLRGLEATKEGVNSAFTSYVSHLWTAPTR